MDTEDLIRLLKEHKVNFVIIEATAMPYMDSLEN